MFRASKTLFFLLLTSLCLGQSTLAVTTKSTGGGVHITRTVPTLRVPIVITNQSNGDGRITYDSIPVALRDSQVIKTYWHDTGLLKKQIAGRNPSFLRRTQDSLSTGVELALSQRLLAINKNIFFIKITRGGAGICDTVSSYFNFKTTSAQAADNVMIAALSFAQDTHRLIMIPFCGENEAEDVTNSSFCAVNFQTWLTTEIRDFRARCGKPVRVVIPRVHSYAAAVNATTVQNAQIATAAAVGNATSFSTEGLQPGSVHFEYWAYTQIADDLFDDIYQTMKKPVIKVNGQ